MKIACFVSKLGIQWSESKKATLSFPEIEIFQNSYLKLETHSTYFYLGCSGGSRAAKIASSKTFFSPF